MAVDQYRTLKGAAQTVAFVGWAIIVLSVLAGFISLIVLAPESPGTVSTLDFVTAWPMLLGTFAGIMLGIIVRAYGQFFACFVQMGRDIREIKERGEVQAMP